MREERRVITRIQLENFLQIVSSAGERISQISITVPDDNENGFNVIVIYEDMESV